MAVVLAEDRTRAAFTAVVDLWCLVLKVVGVKAVAAVTQVADVVCWALAAGSDKREDVDEKRSLR